MFLTFLLSCDCRLLASSQRLEVTQGEVQFDNDIEGPVPRVAAFPESINYWNVSTKPETFFRHVQRGDHYYKDSGLAMAIGDSWFAYPKNWGLADPVNPPSNILTGLGKISRDYWNRNHCALSVLSLSNSGEVVANMAGLSKDSLVDSLESVQRDVNIMQVAGHAVRRAAKLGRKFDYILVSGGGNDLLSNSRLHGLFRHEFRDRADAPLSRIDLNLLNVYLDHICDSYRVLVRYLLSVSPDSIVLAHTYDYFFPSPRGAEFATLPLVGSLVSKGKGGWFFPVAMTYGLTDSSEQRMISNYILDRFAEKLIQLSKETEFRGRFVIVDTRGQMKAYSDASQISEDSLWINEIHLDDRGYEVVSRAFLNKILEVKGEPRIPKFPR